MIGTAGRTRAAIGGKNKGRGSKAAWHEEGDAVSTTTEEISNVEVKSLWQRVKPRYWVPEPLEAYRCKSEECSNKQLQFKTTQLLFEAHLYVDGGRTKAICLNCWEWRDQALGRTNNKTPSTLRCVQAQKSADRWK